MFRCIGLTSGFILALALAGCSPEKQEKEDASKKGAARAETVAATAENKNHPLAKYIEVSGFRIGEKAGGKLAVKMAVVNHSQADVTGLEIEVTVPGCTVSVKIPALGPEEIKDTSSECVSKMRVYELPDWQFVRPSFKITSKE